MRRTRRSISAWLLAVTLIVTSAQWNIIPTKAALDVSNITSDVVITEGTPSFDITADTREIDGVTYNNYTSFEGLKAYSTLAVMGEASKAIDKNLGTRWESKHGEDIADIIVDFGDVYSLKSMAIYWESASAATYEIWVSEDGENFVKVTDVASAIKGRVDEITFSKTLDVRAVKVYCTSRTSAWGQSIYEMAFYGTSEMYNVVTDLVVNDYYKYTGRYMIYFTEPEDAKFYNVYLDDILIKTINGTGEYLDDEDLADIEPGEYYLGVTTVDSNGGESVKVRKKITVLEEPGDYNDIAQVYIYSPISIGREYHDEKDVVINIFDELGNPNVSDTSSNIKIRGNTTASAAKSPWNIKLNKKTSVLGMDKGKKWCLLSNPFDRSLMRNRLSYEMGLDIGLEYNCNSRYADVYVNGRYRGNYLITEPVEAGDGRVVIDAYNAENNDILLELGTRNEEDVNHFTTTVLRTTFDINEPEKDDDLTDEEIDIKIANVQDYLIKFETALKGNDYSEVLKYMDEDSFVDFYIVNELFKNVDFNFSSTRFYIKDDIVYAGPMWDLDLSSGNCKSASYPDYYVDGVSWKGYYCQSMNWYVYLFKHEEFVNRLKNRYYELQYTIQNIYMEGSTQENSIDGLLTQYGASFERNYMSSDLGGAGWNVYDNDGFSYAAESGWLTWEDPINFLRNWLKNRNEWLCSEWDVDMIEAYEEGRIAAGEQEEPEEPTTETPTTTEGQTTEQPNDATTESPTSEEPSAEALTTVAPETTTLSPEEEARLMKKPGKVTIRKINKKKLSAKKIALKIKKVSGATGYEVEVYKSKKLAKKNGKTLAKVDTTKLKIKVKAKRLKNKKKLFVKVRAYVTTRHGIKVPGKWSKIEKVKNKK